MKRTTGLSLVSLLMTANLAYAQTAAPSVSTNSADPALLKQIEEMQKQLDALKAAAGLTPSTAPSQPSAKAASAPKTEGSAATGVKMAEGWVARTHLTKTASIGDRKLGGLEDEPLKAFVLKDLSFPLTKLAEGSKSLPQGKPYGYTLQGYFEAKTAGKHGLFVELVSNVPAKGAVIGGMNHVQDVCATSIKIEDQEVINQQGVVGRERYNNNVYSIAGSGSVELSPGLYKIEATINCSGIAYNKAFDASWSLKVREPDAMEPTVPKVGFVMHKLQS